MLHLLVRLCRASAPLRAAPALSAALALGACVADPGPARYGPVPLGAALPSQAVPLPVPTPDAGPRRVALLLPLTGSNAEVGQAMLKAAQLALAAPGSPQLDSRDTGGTADGAMKAAREALAAGDTLILGPLTSPETVAVAPIARAAQVPVLAFTSDATVAQAGVWPLGITPAQQVRRLVAAAQAENKPRIAAVLPQGAFGDALEGGLIEAVATARLPPARIVRTPATLSGIGGGLKTVSDYSARHPATPADPAAPAAPPPLVDTLLLGVTGPILAQVAPLLPASDLAPTQVRILGPATWARDAASLPGLSGALFAAPDPASRAAFAHDYTARYNLPPRDFADLAYDAAAMARVTAGQGGFDLAALTRPEGFAGADGVVALQPDGRVRRGLALFEVTPAGPHVIQPAATALSPPGT